MSHCVNLSDYDLNKVTTPEQVLALRSLMVAVGRVSTIDFNGQEETPETRFISSLKLPRSVQWMHIVFASLDDDPEEDMNLSQIDLDRITEPEQVLALRGAIVHDGWCVAITEEEQRMMRALKLPDTVTEIWINKILNDDEPGDESSAAEQPLPDFLFARRHDYDAATGERTGPEHRKPDPSAPTATQAPAVMNAPTVLDPHAEARKRGLLLDPVPGGAVQVRRARDQQPVGIYPSIHAALAANP